MSDCDTEYILFCEHTILPNWTVYRVPNKEIWIPHDLKSLLNQKKEALRPWDWEELKRGHQNLREKLRECKDSVRRKPEASPADKREGMCGPG